MSHPFFAYIARMRYIVRWGLMRNTMQENIQEHSHMVATPWRSSGGTSLGERWTRAGWPPWPSTTTRRRFSQGTFPPL